MSREVKQSKVSTTFTSCFQPALLPEYCRKAEDRRCWDVRGIILGIAVVGGLSIVARSSYQILSQILEGYHPLLTGGVERVRTDYYATLSGNDVRRIYT